MKNKNKKKTSMKMGIIVAILLLAVGFAAVSTVLVINGTIKITPDTQNFEEKVIFSEAKASKTGGTGEDEPSAKIEEEGKKITFTTQVMKDIGETSVLTYKVKNNSQYKANIKDISCKQTGTTEQENDNHISIVASDGIKTTLAPQTESSEQTVTVTMIKSFVGNTDADQKTVTFECTIQADAEEATE